ncbi:MAG: hypothetical protein CMB57_05400 [Euryarchaeota archaeon]|nr:hypothetical protein [Euryarchaeota archaeon]
MKANTHQRISHRNSRVAANKVYNELIAHRGHIHMNGAFIRFIFCTNN